jgi:ATP-binding cassette subfamily F protein 3
VSHDRRLLETICDKLWVVDDGAAVPFDGGYRAWRAAIADGWTVGAALKQEADRLRSGKRGTPATATVPATNGAAKAPTSQIAKPRPKREKLSKDAYRRQKATVEADLTRLNLRKNHLELAMGDPQVASNYVELRRVTSELADIEAALATAEDAWLELEERAP